LTLGPKNSAALGVLPWLEEWAAFALAHKLSPMVTEPFDTLQLRLHSAGSRVKLLWHDHPAQMIVFDLQADEHGHSLLD